MSQRPTAIIIIEDDENLRTMYLDLLDQQGYTVIAYRSAEMAMGALTRDKLMPNLILLDYRLPGMDAHTFLQQLQLEGVKPIPTIIVTALPEDNLDIREVKKHPWVKAVLRKTAFTMQQLIQTIQQVLLIQPLDTKSPQITEG